MKRKRKLLIVHGPNLNLLGKREKNLYGATPLKTIDKELKTLAKKRNYETISYQSNIEGQLVTKIQKLGDKVDGILINPAAYSHTSVAIRDALLTTDTPKVEVHMSNIYKREPFRKYSLMSDIVDGQVVGFGAASYRLGLEALCNTIEAKTI